MPTPLQEWRRHRVDYRGPGLLALLLFAAIGLLLPEDWLDLPWLGGPGPRQHQTRELLLSEEQGLQILDLEILSAPPSSVRNPLRVPERVEPALEPESAPEELAGRGEFSWDPTHAYRGGEELLLPEMNEAESAIDVMMRRLEFLLSMDGVASYTLADTSHAVLAHTSFVRLQGEIFRKNAPIWAYEKAVERYRILYNRMIFDNPLRGPQ